MFTPSTDWREQIPDGEAAEFEALAERLRALQRRRAQKAPLGRALHYRSHGDPIGTLRILPELPAWAAVGPFSAPGELAAICRFSNGNGRDEPDNRPDARGLAVKLLGVPGPKILPGLEHALTWDLVCILNRTMPMRTAADFVDLVEASSSPPLRAIGKFVETVGWKQLIPTVQRLQAGLGRPVPSLCAVEWHTSVPIRWGQTAVKYGFFPVSSSAPSPAISDKAPDRLAQDLRARLSAGPVVFELRIQGFVDEQRTPIEDPTVLWEDAVSPWLPVARLELPAQDLDSPEGLRRFEAIEKMSFDPWHAPAEFRPLGAIMRARAAAYRLSGIERAASAEPTALP